MLSHSPKVQLRPLPVFLLTDTSGSMHGEKIQCVNNALREMIPAFSDLNNPKGVIKISLITFGKEVEVIYQMKDTKDIQLNELTAYGKTPMGAGLEKTVELIEDKSIVPENSFYSTIVLISDGLPTDCPIEFLRQNDFSNWKPLQKIFNSECTKKSQRLALAIGDDANINLLKAFVGDPNIPIIEANETRTITKFFKWITMSVSVRSQSVDPNKPVLIPVKDFFGDEELIF